MLAYGYLMVNDPITTNGKQPVKRSIEDREMSNARETPIKSPTLSGWSTKCGTNVALVKRDQATDDMRQGYSTLILILRVDFFSQTRGQK
ncbi:hypothetical protein TWF281_005303 [Arthrobotrys megalospora]